MKTTLTILSAAMLLTTMSCMETDVAPQKQTLNAPTSASSTMARSSMNGRMGSMPAYYDSTQFTVNMMELPDKAAAAIIAKNQSLNEIYASNDLDDPQDFVPVIDAIQGDGFNPLWLQFLIVFNPGFTPHQFFSDVEVEAAAAGPNPEITLVNTGEVYRCSVIGPK